MGDEAEAVTAVTAQPLVIVAGTAGREVRLRDHRTARVVAGVLAVLLAAGVARWLQVAVRSVDPCGSESALLCKEATAGIRWTQLVVAVAGGIAGAVVVGYCLRFATLATVWRRRGTVVAVFLGLACAWVVIYTVGTITVRS